MPKARVAYYYKNDIGHHYYGPGHPMKPHRMKLTHHLILAYGLYRKMSCYRPHLASPEELTRFHSDDYIDFLRRVTPENVKVFAAGGTSSILSRYNMGEFTDCPVFSGLFQYCQAYAGASIDGAVRLNHGQCDIAVNWAGGLHHAKKCEASGFCYVNDIVLGILELLKHHARVLYIDIDVHHGDGVEEAFLTTDRVMTVSFHKFGDFFPGTGAVKDVGFKSGKYYSVNFPLCDGIDDDSYHSVFKPVITRIMETYRPGAVVLQCGADSLTGDRLGVFNLTIKGHAECVRFVKSFGLPLLLLGGGGYTIRNVARCWASETATACDTVLPDVIAPNDYIEYYKPDYRLHLDPASGVENLNSREYLEKVKSIILENLRYIEAAPSVAFTDVPPDWAIRDAEEELRFNGGARHADARATGVAQGAREHEAEYYDGEADVDKDRHADPATAAAVAAATAAVANVAATVAAAVATVSGSSAEDAVMQDEEVDVLAEAAAEGLQPPPADDDDGVDAPSVEPPAVDAGAADEQDEDMPDAGIAAPTADL